MPELSSLGAVIDLAYEGQPDNNAFTDAEKATLASLAAETLGAAVHLFDFIPSQDHAGILAGTDENDHASEINAAFTEGAAAGPYGARVYASRGTYWITETLLLANRVSFEGEGMFQTAIKLVAAANCDMIRLSSDLNEFYGIHRMTFDGNKANQGTDDGTGATNYRGIEIIQRASPAQQAAASSRVDFGDPTPTLSDLLVYDTKGDGVFIQDTRGLRARRIKVRNTGRHGWFSKSADSGYSDLDIGPCQLGPGAVIHDSITSYTGCKFWGAGGGNDDEDAMLDLWNNMTTAFTAGEATSGYPYANANGVHLNNFAGAQVLLKGAGILFQGIIQDCDGSGVIINCNDAIIDLILDRPGEIQDQFNLPFATLSQNGTTPLPVTKFGVHIETGIVNGRIVGRSGTANIGKPTTFFNNASGADEGTIHLATDGSWTNNTTFAAWRNSVFVNGQLAIPERTATQIAAAADAINTQGKRRGRIIWDSTNSQFLIASNSAATDTWLPILTDTAVTPS